jgi:hypothetical protein
MYRTVSFTGRKTHFCYLVYFLFYSAPFFPLQAGPKRGGGGFMIMETVWLCPTRNCCYCLERILVIGCFRLNLWWCNKLMSPNTIGGCKRPDWANYTRSSLKLFSIIYLLPSVNAIGKTGLGQLPCLEKWIGERKAQNRKRQSFGLFNKHGLYFELFKTGYSSWNLARKKRGMKLFLTSPRHYGRNHTFGQEMHKQQSFAQQVQVILAHKYRPNQHHCEGSMSCTKTNIWGGRAYFFAGSLVYPTY